jgi:adenylosuccinate synthase
MQAAPVQQQQQQIGPEALSVAEFVSPGYVYETRDGWITRVREVENVEDIPANAWEFGASRH